MAPVEVAADSEHRVGTPKPNQTPVTRRAPSSAPGPSTVTRARIAWVSKLYSSAPLTATSCAKRTPSRVADRPEPSPHRFLPSILLDRAAGSFGLSQPYTGRGGSWG